MNGHHPSHKYYCTVSYSQKYYYIIAIYNNNTYSAGMKERCRDGCRTSLLYNSWSCSCSYYFSYFTSTMPSLHHHSFHGNDFFPLVIIHLQYVRALLWFTSGMITTVAQKYSCVFISRSTVFWATVDSSSSAITCRSVTWMCVAQCGF